MDADDYGKLVDAANGYTNKELANRMMLVCHDAPPAARALMIEAAFRLEKLKGERKLRR